MGTIARALCLERNTYHATQLGTRIESPIEDARGVLLEVIPNPDNHGPASMAAVYEAMYEPATNPVHSFEIWFHKGEARFFILADSEESADSIRRSIGNSYEDSIVKTVSSGGEAFPTIVETDSVAGAYLQKAHPTENHEYLPIKYFADGNGWLSDQNPIADIISHMRADKETSVIVQSTIEPVSNSEWTDAKWYLVFDESASEIQEVYQNRGDSDLKRMVGKQTSQSPFVVNLRVLAISPSEHEARNRAQSVAGLMERRFTSEVSNIGLSATAVDAPFDFYQQRRMNRFIKRMCDRKMNYATCSGLGHKELTALHIPSGESNPPGINWEHSRSGSDAPVGRPEHTTPSLDDLDDSDLPVVGRDQ